MTDAQAPTLAAGRRPGKRERLIDAASVLLHRQGVERTTLAHIATAAQVPVGGVYYYFKTKDEVVGAVIDAHARQTASVLARIERGESTPKGRLKALVRQFAEHGETLARFGCPLGSLCSELDKRDDDPALAAQLMRVPIAWAERQIRDLGREDAYDLALDLMAAYEGHALLANTLRDPEGFARAAARLERWIDGL